MIAFDEALHGLARNGATAFPQSIGMAASFDTTLMGQVARPSRWRRKRAASAWC
ncbi:MAG: hypothetical protein IPN38_17185 [Flavobacteriales bacterium]|nr:hypothetical protein [Flavobacteriales bacterium]